MELRQVSTPYSAIPPLLTSWIWLCRSSDVVIAVMGITGSGKSTFISKLADQEVPVGHGLKSSESHALSLQMKAN